MISLYLPIYQAEEVDALQTQRDNQQIEFADKLRKFKIEAAQEKAELEKQLEDMRQEHALVHRSSTILSKRVYSRYFLAKYCTWYRPHPPGCPHLGTINRHTTTSSRAVKL